MYLKNANYWYLLLAYPFILMNIFLKAVRWNFLMKTQGVRNSIFESFYVYLWAFYFGAVTPGRIGEISKALYYQEKFDNFGSSLSSVVVDRAYDVGIRIAMIFILYPFYNNLFHFKYVDVIILLSCIIAGIVVLAKYKSIQNIIIAFSKFLVPQKYYATIQNNISGFINDIIHMVTTVKYVAVSIAITIPSFLCYCTVGYLILKSFGVDMAFTYNVFCLAVSSFSVAVPISVSGLGVREAVMIFLFNSIGLGRESAVLFSLSIFALSPILGFHGWLVNLIMLISNQVKKKVKAKVN
jgi:uncharacterized protein (TIRG00374 family)